MKYLVTGYEVKIRDGVKSYIYYLSQELENSEVNLGYKPFTSAWSSDYVPDLMPFDEVEFDIYSSSKGLYIKNLRKKGA